MKLAVMGVHVLSVVTSVLEYVCSCLVYEACSKRNNLSYPMQLWFAGRNSKLCCPLSKFDLRLRMLLVYTDVQLC